METEDLANKSLDFIKDIAVSNRIECRNIWCDELFTNQSEINCYEHHGGIKLAGFDKKQWVTIKCQKCGTESSLWKIVNRINIKNQLGGKK